MRTTIYDLMNDLSKAFFEEGYNAFPVNVMETENGYVVDAYIPGAKKEDINVEFENSNLTITVNPKKEEDNKKYLLHERRNMKLERVINFDDVKEDNMTAKYENGILTVNINVSKDVNTKKQIVID